MKRALTILNETGDVTIVWDETNDERMIEIIERKMKAGVTFFLIEPRMNGIVPPDKKPLKKAKDALKHRALSIQDEDLEAMVSEGKAELVKTPDAPVRTRGRARTAREVATGGEVVAVQPRRGG